MEIAIGFMLPSPYFIPHGELLVRSVRQMKGFFSKIPIYVMVPEEEKDPVKSLWNLEKEAQITAFEIQGKRSKFPFKDKIHAAFGAEQKALQEGISQLIWMDTDSFFVREKENLLLNESEVIGLRPVDKQNIGVEWDTRKTSLWKFIMEKLQVEESSLFPIRSSVDEILLYPYFNAGFFVTRPEQRLMKSWKDAFEELFLEEKLLSLYEQDFRNAIFIHQVVFSMVVISRFSEEQIKMLSADISFPLHLLEEMSEKRKLDLKEAISCRYDTFFNDSNFDIYLLPLEMQRQLEQSMEELKMAWYYEG